MGSNKGKIFNNHAERVQFYSKRLEFLWGKYLTVVHLLISLSGGTVLIFLNSTRISQLKGSLESKLSIGFAALALVCSLLWRFVSQFFMEHEVLGDCEEIKSYYRESHMSEAHVTSTYRSSASKIKFFKILYKIIPYVAIVFLLMSWVVFYLFINSIK